MSHIDEVQIFQKGLLQLIGNQPPELMHHDRDLVPASTVGSSNSSVVKE